MGNKQKVRVYVACSLDGFMAGVNDDLSWLPGATPESDKIETPDADDPEAGCVSYEQFISEVGAIVMGRTTLEVLLAFGGEWPYGEMPILVATNRPLRPVAETVKAVQGDIGTIIADAKKLAGEKDVYVDGGEMIRQAIDARLVEDFTVTVAPIILGEGRPCLLV
jgi:dihydrofolate reductase